MALVALRSLYVICRHLLETNDRLRQTISDLRCALRTAGPEMPDNESLQR